MAKTREFRKRSRASKKGWRTRRKREAAEFRRRSRAAKKGWKRRKAKARIKALAKAPVKKGKGPLREWVVSRSVKSAGRIKLLGFYVIARSAQEAEHYTYEAIDEGQDSKGQNIAWAEKIDWTEIDTALVTEDEKRFSAQEIKELGEGWVEVR